VESHGDGLAVVVVGELVVVVPAIPAVLVAVAMGADTREFDEAEVTGFGEFSDSDGAAARVERDRYGAAVDGKGLLLDAGALFDAALSAAWALGVGFGGGDAVDGEQAEVPRTQPASTPSSADSQRSSSDWDTPPSMPIGDEARGL
jgi:hypothetical protein